MSQTEPENAPQLAATRVGDDESKAAFSARKETVDDAAGERDGRDGQDGRDASPSPPSSSCVDASLLAEELSASTLAALQDFLSAQAAAAQHQHALSAQAADTGSAEGGRAGGDEAGGAARDGEGAGTTGGQEAVEDALFAEDWGLSQFWYDAHTSATVAAEVARLMGGGAACARADEEGKGEEAEEKPREEADGESAGGGKGVERKEGRGNGEGEGESSVGSGGPRSILLPPFPSFPHSPFPPFLFSPFPSFPFPRFPPFPRPPRPSPNQRRYPTMNRRYPAMDVHLLEYDRRFAAFAPRFSRYDYRTPLDVPAALHHRFDVVVADPPYLSEECLEKTAQTMKLLAKEGDSTATPPSLLLLTGAVQAEAAKRLLQLRPAVFRPEHRNKLGNDFRLFTSYPPPQSLGGWEPDS
ncbi:unnamed protein product [Closterium sp. NIES-64]|nr:unnamed protein product [Closterium sp. NIES-64]